MIECYLVVAGGLADYITCRSSHCSVVLCITYIEHWIRFDHLCASRAINARTQTRSLKRIGFDAEEIVIKDVD